MKANDKFNVLAIISIVLFVINYIITFSSSKSNNLALFLTSIIVVTSYALYQKKHFYKNEEIKIKKLGDDIKQLEMTYDATRETINKIVNSAEDEEKQAQDIASALENTSMMVIRNKENTRQASQLTKDVIHAVESGNVEMNMMLQSISEIKTLSDEIQKIIKVIDDIAFQTNILALNAAVEAARAGDAGKGFAVVADEVRNLAQKSADAANNSSKIIEENILSAENGVKISSRVEDALIKTKEQITMVEELIDEITASSEEQANEVVRTKELAIKLSETVVETCSSREKGIKNIEVLKNSIDEITEATKMIEDGVVIETFDEDEKVDKKEKENVFDSKVEKVQKEENIKCEVKTPEKEIEVKHFDTSSTKSVDTSNHNSIEKNTETQHTASATNTFNNAAFEAAKKENDKPKVSTHQTAAKSSAEAILPLDDDDDF